MSSTAEGRSVIGDQDQGNNQDLQQSLDKRPVARSVSRRRKAVGLVVLVAVLAGAVGWFAGSRIVSPSEAAARAQPPAPSLITAPVERKVLSDDYITRGSVFSTQTIGVGPAIIADAPGGRSVVTRGPVSAGDRVSSGQVVLEVSGRPVIALPGTLPAYRDLVVGESGPDVAQAQKALAGLGISTAPDALGSFGDGTSRGFAALYRRLRYSPAPDGGLPAVESVWLSSLPVRVTAATAVVGAAPTDTSVMLSGGDLQVIAGIPLADSALIRAGQKVELYSETLDRSVSGVVASIAAKPPSGAVQAGVVAADQPDASMTYVVVKPSATLPDQFQAQDLRVSIKGASTSGPVLTVPITAISQRADGTATITVIANKQTATLPVRVGLIAAGQAEVSTVTGQLSEGQLVVVGTDQSTGTGG